MHGEVSAVEVAGFLRDFNTWTNGVQRQFQILADHYASGNLMYDSNGEFTEHNLRYVTHPATNRAEGNIANMLVTKFGAPVELAITVQDQVEGIDIITSLGPLENVTVSVKLCSAPPDMRSFLVSTVIADAIAKEHIPDLVAFCDNINQIAILVPHEHIRLVLNVNRSNPSMMHQSKIRVFYDQLPPYVEKIELNNNDN